MKPFCSNSPNCNDCVTMSRNDCGTFRNGATPFCIRPLRFRCRTNSTLSQCFQWVPMPLINKNQETTIKSLESCIAGHLCVSRASALQRCAGFSL
jgi:hypothetical protein